MFLLKKKVLKNGVQSWQNNGEKAFHLQHTVSAPVRVAFMCFFLKNEKYERMVKMVS